MINLYERMLAISRGLNPRPPGLQSDGASDGFVSFLFLLVSGKGLWLWHSRDFSLTFFIPRHTIVAGYYGFTSVVWESVRLSVRPSVRPSYVRPSVRPSVFRFRMITWVNINGFSPNLVCALMLWRSGLGLLMGKFCQFLTKLSARDTHIFSFPDYNLSK